LYYEGTSIATKHTRKVYNISVFKICSTILWFTCL